MFPKFAALERPKKFHVNQVVDVTIGCDLGAAIRREKAAIG